MPFLTRPDPDYSSFTRAQVETLFKLRRIYQWGTDTTPLLLNMGRGQEEPFTPAIALEFGERLADEVLA